MAKRISPRSPKRRVDGCCPPRTAARSSAPTGPRRSRMGGYVVDASMWVNWLASEAFFDEALPRRRQGDADPAELGFAAAANAF